MRATESTSTLRPVVRGVGAADQIAMRRGFIETVKLDVARTDTLISLVT
jgi:hypothetical protein